MSESGFKCLDPDSSNFGRGCQTLPANLNAIILPASYELFFILGKSKKILISKFGHQIKEWEDISYSFKRKSHFDNTFSSN